MKPISERRRNQRGFALLMIFLMAAAIALMLYIQLPRVAFETEREKEQLLIDRGEQYKRAIQLYYTAYQRYPGRMEDLESTNDKRYLRHRYKDPYTGKEEWRLIHINGGMLTDSLVQKPPAPGNGPPGSSSSQLAGSSSSPTPTPANTATSTTDPNAPPAVNQAVLQRPSDRTLPTSNTFNQTAQAANPFPNPVPGQFNQPPNYNDPASYPPMSLYPNGYNAPPVNQQQPGFNQPGFNQPGFNPGVGQPGLNQPGLNQPGLGQPGLGQPGFAQPGLNQPGLNQPGIIQPGMNQPGLNQPGLNVQPGGIQQAGLQQNFSQAPPGQQFPVQQVPGQPPSGGLPGGFVPGVPNQPGLNPNFPNQFPDPNNPGNGQQPPVQQQVFQPNPLAGLPPNFPGGTQPNNQAINLINNLLTTPRQPPPGIGPTTTQQTSTGVGLAGVASTYTGPAIMSYGDRTEFEEWEFIFQPKTQQGVISGAPPLGPNGQGRPPGQQPGQGAPPGMPAQPNTTGLVPRF